MKIICTGDVNYADSRDAVMAGVCSSDPVVYLKPDSSLLKCNKPFYLPYFSKEIGYGVELVYRISRLGKNIDEKYACRYYDSIALGVSLTACDLQRRLSGEGKPWEISNSFDGSSVISDYIPLTEIKDRECIRFSLAVNGDEMQCGSTRDMICRVDKMISYVSRFFTLKTGDLIYTGTPAGGGMLRLGDELSGKIEDREMMRFDIK